MKLLKDEKTKLKFLRISADVLFAAVDKKWGLSDRAKALVIAADAYNGFDVTDEKIAAKFYSVSVRTFQKHLRDLTNRKILVYFQDDENLARLLIKVNPPSKWKARRR